jgi:hypothetical protein
LIIQIGKTQATQFGIRASIGFCTANAEDQLLLTPDNKLEYKLSFMKHSSSKAIGLFFQKKIGFIYLQPEILYRSTQVKYEMVEFLSRDYTPHKMTETYHQLHMPLTAGMHFNNIRLGAGPVFNYSLDTDSAMSTMEHLEQKNSNWTYGFQFGMGYDYYNFSLDFKYEVAFSKIGEHIYHTNEKRTFSQNPNLLTISIGLRI